MPDDMTSQPFSIDLFRSAALDSPLVRNVWMNKYRFTKPGGWKETTIAQSKRRVVEAVFAGDPDNVAKELCTRAVMDGYFLPAGRQNAGAGTGRNVTLQNCYVGGPIQDSMPGIQWAISQDAFTLQQGGGTGSDFSTIRPNGAIVRRTGSVASGAIAFMKQRSAMSDTVCSAGERRGAMMTTLADWHPDLWNERQFETAKNYRGELKLIMPSFLSVKTERDVMTQTNISVLVSDDLMRAVAEDWDWDLGFWVPRADGEHVEVQQRPFPIDAIELDNKFQVVPNDKLPKKGEKHPWYVYRRLKARQLWDDIMRATYKYAEPGVIFIDRMNNWNNLHYCEEIRSTNPCFDADTLIATDRGAFAICELVGQTVNIWNGTAWQSVDNFRVTGTNQPMLHITLQDGSELRVTPYHGMILEDGTEKTAGELQEGDRLLLSDVTYNGDIALRAAYLKGFLLGDGALRVGKRPELHLYPPKFCCCERLIESAQEIPQGRINTNADPVLGFTLQENEQGQRWNMTGLAPLGYDLVPWCGQNKTGLPYETFRLDYQSKCEFLAGVFDSDGSGFNTEHGFQYQLTACDRQRLLDIQTMLKSIGVRSSVSLAKPAGRKNIKGKEYDLQASWRLFVSQYYSVVLARQVKFSRLPSFADKVAKQRKTNHGTVVQVVDDGVDDKVYCCTVNPSHRVTTAELVTTSQCGEQPLPPWGTCCLGSINLAFMVEEPFTPNARMNVELLRGTVDLAIRYLDNVLDVSQYPLEEQRAESMAKRRIGLGLTGLADAFIQMGIRYGDTQSIHYAQLWTQVIQQQSYMSSAQLAKERGAFPLFDKDKFLGSPNVRKLPKTTIEMIAETGIRNGVLNTVAPNGTISIYSGETGQGIEPILSLEKLMRKVRQPDGSLVEFEQANYSYKLYEAMFGETPRDKLPPYFIDAMSGISLHEHVLVQAAVQKYVDASISKTTNVPTETTFEAFRDIYSIAYQNGLKGLTTYRDDPESGRGSVLSVTKNPDAVPVLIQQTLPPADLVEARRHRLKWPQDGRNWYVTFTRTPDNHPFEMFLNGGNPEVGEWMEVLGRLVTAVFRRGGDLRFLVEQMTAIHSARGGASIPSQQRFRPSLIAALGGVMEQEFRLLGLYDEAVKPTEGTLLTPPVAGIVHGPAILPVQTVSPSVPACPECGLGPIVHQEGCTRCAACGWSNCG